MSNAEIAKLLNEIAELYEILGVAWKPRAYQKGSRQILALQDDVVAIYEEGGIKALQALDGIGKGISMVIEEVITTGDVSELKELKKKVPSGVLDMRRVQGVGPKKARRLYKELGIDSLDKLEKAAKAKKIQELQGFGPKSEQEILNGLDFARKGTGRRRIGDVLPLARQLLEDVRNISGVSRAELAGSVRRRRDTCKDIDILAISTKHTQVFDAFVKLPLIRKVLAQGSTKAAVILKNGINCDLRVIEPKSFGGALQYFTGSKEHNVAVRKVAVAKGYKLSEYGLFNAKTNTYICGKTEEEIYKKLGFPYYPPEIRENRGELKLKKPPELVDVPAIKGDVHMHTTWSDGVNSTEEMIKAAIAKQYEYIAITDHSVSEKLQNGLTVKRVKEHFKEIDALQKKYPQITILKGSEVDILKDGSLDYPDSVLKTMDVVVASIHTHFRMSKEDMTKRLCKGLSNPHVTIAGHLTGRLINTRPSYDLDFDAICDVAEQNNVALEVNAGPARLDINDAMVRHAIDRKLKICINTDAHATSQLDTMEFGVAQARRGWATASDVVNTLPKKKFLNWLKNKET